MGRGVLCAVSGLVALGLGPYASASAYDETTLLGIAREAVLGKPLGLSSARHAPRPVFVTIEVGNVVRGCRGGLVARTSSLEEEVFAAATAAARHDPRYRPLAPAEFATFKVTVTVVEGQQPISGVASLTPADGLVLQHGNRFGIVLPWEGRDPTTRLKWAYRKAGVPEGFAAKLFRLTATRFRG